MFDVTIWCSSYSTIFQWNSRTYFHILSRPDQVSLLMTNLQAYWRLMSHISVLCSWQNWGWKENRRINANARRGNGEKRRAGRIFWHLSDVQGESDRRQSGMPGDGQSLSYELLYLLLVRSSFAWKGFLQCQWTRLLWGRLSGESLNWVSLNDNKILTLSMFHMFSIRDSSKRLRNAIFAVTWLWKWWDIIIKSKAEDSIH